MKDFETQKNNYIFQASFPKIKSENQNEIFQIISIVVINWKKIHTKILPFQNAVIFFHTRSVFVLYNIQNKVISYV